MARRGTPPGRRVEFESKDALLAGGRRVKAFRYQRASADKKKQGKSVADQAAINAAEIGRLGWTDADSFTDNDRSSSRHARKDRPDFERLMEAIGSGQGDVLVIWEIGRSQRDLAVYVRIRDLCVTVGLNFWLVGGVLYDLRDRNDRMMLGIFAVQAEFQADYIRDNIMRGMLCSAEAGRPHGPVVYGYRRIYDQHTRALLRQEPDTEIRRAVAADGTVSEYSTAGIVREHFERVAAGVPLITIERELNARGVPSAKGRLWSRGLIRKQVLNPSYIGKRTLNGEVVADAIWPPLVDEETFWACARLLRDPARRTTRPGRAVHLLSYIVRCGVCGAPLSASTPTRNGRTTRRYWCQGRRCTTVDQDILDEYVQRVVVAWLSRDDVYQMLVAQAGGDETVARARSEAARLRDELEQWRRLAERGEVSAISFARTERGLMTRIAEYDRKAADAGIPPVLRGRLGDEAVRAWADLDDQMAVRREIIQTVADIRLLRGVKGSHNSFGRQRLDWRWKLGPASDETH